MTAAAAAAAANTVNGVIPVILCGRTPAIGRAVAQSLRPRFSVISVSLDPVAASHEVPDLLRIRDDDDTRRPAAVAVGASYTHDDVETIRRATRALHQPVVAVKWLMIDRERMATTKIKMNDESTLTAYGNEVGKRVAACLHALDEQGRLYDGKDEIALF